MPKININHADYYYELHGLGQPIVCIAGYTVDHQLWAAMLEQLTQHFQVLIFDNRGVGQTQDDGRELSAELMAQDTAELIKKLNLSKPHIIGQSMGGTIGQRMASRYPEAVNKLVILTSTAKWRQAALRGMNSHLLMREKNIDIDLILESVMPWVLGENFLSDAKNITNFKELCINNPNPQTLSDQKRQYNVLKQFDGGAELQKINAPTLVIHAVEDELVLAQESEFLASRIHNAHLVKISCAHAMPVEEPAALNNELIQFLK